MERDAECHFRLRMISHMIDNLSEDEVKAYPVIKTTLAGKLERGEMEIDLLAMQDICWRKQWIITEVMCRRMINKFEFEEVGKKVFTLKNGNPAWEKE